jgi:hypothetical protein
MWHTYCNVDNNWTRSEIQGQYARERRVGWSHVAVTGLSIF